MKKANDPTAGKEIREENEQTNSINAKHKEKTERDNIKEREEVEREIMIRESKHQKNTPRNRIVCNKSQEEMSPVRT